MADFDLGMDSYFYRNLFRQDLQDKLDYLCFISRMEMKKPTVPKAQKNIACIDDLVSYIC